MNMNQPAVEIRERAPDEMPLWVEVRNAALPPEGQVTVEQATLQESWEKLDLKYLKLLAWSGDRAVATGYGGQESFGAAGRFRVAVAVRPEFRRQGIGTELYRRLAAFGAEQGAQALVCQVDERYLPIVEPWIEREGFRESERMRPSELSLEGWDDGTHRAAIERVEKNGFILSTLGAEDTAENRRKLWELYNRTHHDVPHEVVEDKSFDRFQDMIGRPVCLLDCLVVARDGERYAGFSILADLTGGRAVTWMTGVHPDYRNRGIALAVKVRSAELAREHGFRVMRTFNHVNNPAMLAVNTRVGYRALPEVVTFVKPLREGDSGEA